MIIQITIEVNMKDYGEPDTLEAGIQLAHALVKGHADWPEKIRLDACKGETMTREIDVDSI